MEGRALLDCEVLREDLTTLPLSFRILPVWEPTHSGSYDISGINIVALLCIPFIRIFVLVLIDPRSLSSYETRVSLHCPTSPVPPRQL